MAFSHCAYVDEKKKIRSTVDQEDHTIRFLMRMKYQTRLALEILLNSGLDRQTI
jgi:hypothetical protein